MDAVIYARYSCDRQTEQSIEGQLRECREYAARHDITIVDTYIDRAISGRSDNRKQFQRMIKDSAKRQFGAVIVYKTDRFARNRYDSAKYKAALKKNDVRVLYAKESIPDGPEGIILESMLEGMAEYYSAELSQKVNRGMHETALKCRVTGSMPLGYKAGEDKRYCIDDKTSGVVQMIFEMYDKGSSVVDICAHLNAIGARTSYGKPFRGTSVNAILNNEKYTGVYRYADVMIEGGIPALIDKEQFGRVQNRLAANRKAPGKGRDVDYLLTGKLYCGKCDAGMYGESGKGQAGTKYTYYACVNQKKHKTCDKKRVQKDWLENLVVEETVKNILNPEQIDIIAKNCVAIQQKEFGDDAELKLLNRRLSETKKTIENIMTAIEQGIITKNTKERLLQLEQEEAQIQFEISNYNNVVPDLTEAHIKYLLSQYQREDNTPDETYNKDIIDCFVYSVHLYDNRLCITYNLTEDGQELKKTDLDLAVSGDGKGSAFDRIGKAEQYRCRLFRLPSQSDPLCKFEFYEAAHDFFGIIT